MKATATGVLFDLFGTIVPPFRMREHKDVIRQCADCLGIDVEHCHRHWVETYPRRIRGAFASVAENLQWIAAEAHVSVSARALADAEDIYLRFTTEGMRPVAGAIEVLQWLKTSDIRVGLVTNCAPDIPRVWPGTNLAPYFQYCAFSCEVGFAKPAPEIYRAALQGLALSPGETIYVGDGSDSELSGARGSGLHAVLVSADLSNTYDASRVDVDAWEGPRIQSLSEMPALIEGARYEQQ